MEKENPGPRALSRSCRVVHANIGALHKNLPDLYLNARGGDVIYYSETIVTSRRHISELMVQGLGRLMQLPKGNIAQLRVLTVYVCDGFSAYRPLSYTCGCCEVVVLRICNISRNFYVFGVYRNPGLSDKTFDCLLTAMAI